MSEPDPIVSRSMTNGPKVRPSTIGEAIRYVTGEAPENFIPLWPPNVFGLCAYLLCKNGRYIRVIQSWPPTGMDNYAHEIRTLAKEWRSAAPDNAPGRIKEWWNEFLTHCGEELSTCSPHSRTCELLILLCVAADEACAGMGIPDPSKETQDKDFYIGALYLLRTEQTLSVGLRKEICRVFPKSHTPQCGITLRSISHHLSFLWGTDVMPSGNYNPWMDYKGTQEYQSLNLLLIPYPFTVEADSFSPNTSSRPLRNLGTGFKFFDYQTPATNEVVDQVLLPLVAKATKKVGRIDGIILPEISLTDATYERFWQGVKRDYSRAFLAAGIGGRTHAEGMAKNLVRVAFSMIGSLGSPIYDQAKHHRWKLTDSQIRQYDLCHRLDPFINWWEGIDVDLRQLYFFAAEPWLTMCFLICEDLARQDPVAQAVRSVGPNLIISLLMDGPQLSGRWANRYATVFADDPGSSVLSMTSLGMALRSKAPGVKPPSRVVALWKEPNKPSREIALGTDSQ